MKPYNPRFPFDPAYDRRREGQRQRAIGEHVEQVFDDDCREAQDNTPSKGPFPDTQKGPREIPSSPDGAVRALAGVQDIAAIAWKCIKECKDHALPPVMCVKHQLEAEALLGSRRADPPQTRRALEALSALAVFEAEHEHKRHQLLVALEHTLEGGLINE